MHPGDERNVFASRLTIVLERLAETVEAIAPANVGRRVLPDGNTAAVIVAHVIGAARGAVLGIGCALDVERNRVEEFATSGGTPQSLGEALRAFAAEASAALRAVPDGRLDELTTPPQSWMGITPAVEMPRRAAILSSIAHASEHLGELMFIKDTFAQREASL